MESLETSFATYMAKASPKQKKAQHIAQNNAALARAIIATWATAESAALYLLSHINTMYICEDTRAYKGDAEQQKHFIMQIYVDDPLAKTEINARRELLLHYLHVEGISAEEIILFSATRGMKQRKLYPEFVAHLQAGHTTLPTHAQKTTFVSADPLESKSHQDQQQLLECFKRAVCLSFAQLDDAASFLAHIEGAAMENTNFIDRRTTTGGENTREGKPPRPSYCMHLFVQETDIAPCIELMNLYGSTLQSSAYLIGFRLNSIMVHQSPAALAGKTAYPRLSQPVPLVPLDLSALRSKRLYALSHHKPNCINVSPYAS